MFNFKGNSCESVGFLDKYSNSLKLFPFRGKGTVIHYWKRNVVVTI